MNKLDDTVVKPVVRMRRLRATPQIRAMIQETQVSVDDLILPLFISANITNKTPIPTMPGHAQLTLADLPGELSRIADLKIPAVLLFGIPSYKDALGSSAWQDDGIIQQAIAVIKQTTPDVLVITDLCFCEYTDHGHCGALYHERTDYMIDNDTTLDLLVKQAISHAKAGADIIAPSGMMDGMIQAIRQGLDQAGFSHIALMSYAVKYASAFYGPFREAAAGAPQSGDRKTHQMNPANAGIGLREASLDVAEGADMLLIKPGMPYLDMIQRVKQQCAGVPVVAYQVSGEFAMIKVAAEQNILNEQEAVMETMLCFKRAGADMIITYFAKELAQWLS